MGQDWHSVRPGICYLVFTYIRPAKGQFVGENVVGRDKFDECAIWTDDRSVGFSKGRATLVEATGMVGSILPAATLMAES